MEWTGMQGLPSCLKVLLSMEPYLGGKKGHYGWNCNGGNGYRRNSEAVIPSIPTNIQRHSELPQILSQCDILQVKLWKRARRMETKEFQDVHGGKITLHQEAHSGSCREFSVVCPKLSIRSVTSSTCAVWLVAYAVFACTENTLVLSAAIMCTIFGLLLYLHFMKIDQESVLLIGSLGIQLTTSFASGKESTVFIEMCRVKDVVINEAFFMSSKPRMDCLVEVYRSCQEILSVKSCKEENTD
ncbi:hypothetical protein XELAEV_18026818mg [Xenopus laevis]|uniref:Phosphatidylinositol N-acetylglucosaminyltransferase subunit H conserved domain-containing protein n=1 Tax=Xenopus laevis TaxID=8355 RepID=A0A974CUE3_XENLA|nr:hypothetical protein XELAEV_18026818mg [Xenopus laevis]